MKPSTLLLAALAAASSLAGCAQYGAPKPAPGAEPPRRVVFACETAPSMAVTFAGDGATLEAQGRTVRLAQQPAASGIHYAGGGHDLRGKGADATWRDAAGVTRQCREQAAAPQGLAGSEWQLVQFESSDDRIGRKVPPRPERYRLTFAADGSLALQLDCNRAMARWEAKPSSPAGGALTLTGGAMTRAFCGPDALDAQIARDLPRLRSYRFAGGRLALALEADGGIYLWAPASPAR